MFFSLSAISSMSPANRLAMICIPVVLILIAVILPRNTVIRTVTRTAMICLIAVLLAFQFIKPLTEAVGMNGVPSTAPYFTNFLSVILLVEIVILLWGMFFHDAYLTQGLYGIVFGISITLGIAGFAFPEWLNVVAFDYILLSANSVYSMLQYAALVFVPAWLVASGSYRIRFGSSWHVLAGMSFFGSLLLFTTQAGYITSNFGEKMMNLFTGSAPGAGNLLYCGIFAGSAIILTLVVSFLASFGRKKFSPMGEKWIQSETKRALWIRIIGRLISSGISLVVVIVTPVILSATGLKGTAAAIVCLIPLALLIVAEILTEFFSEDAEIKQAQADWKALNDASSDVA